MERNGLELETLEGIVDAIRGQPRASTVTIRSDHCWEGGLAVDGYAREIENAGEFTSRAFTFRTDWPVEVAGGDSGPAPGEVLLAALGGCVGMTFIMQAARRGVDVDSLEVSIEAEWDMRGVFELDEVRGGLANVAVAIALRADASDEVVRGIGEMVTRTSAVYNSLAHPVPIELSVRRI